MTDFSAYYVAIAADNAWHAELIRLFGKQACNVRYTAKAQGEPGSKLNALYLIFRSTTNAWLKQMAKA